MKYRLFKLSKGGKILEYSLNLTIEQKLIMTQQMQLSVKLLQMSTFELQNYVDKELIENPLLEVEQNLNKDEIGLEKIDYQEFFKYLDNGTMENKYYQQEEEENSPFNFISNAKSLKQYLHEQIMEISLDNLIREICGYMIESIDERGYLCCSVEEIAYELNCKEDLAYKALVILQDLEPSGIGARNLKECLKLQLIHKKKESEELFFIIDNCLELIGEHRYAQISKLLKISIEEVQQLCDLIKTLEPKPSRGFYTGETIEYIMPDAYITQIENKQYIVMNEDALPRLKINNIYKNIIMNEKDKDAVNYVKDKINSAIFLINSIEKRKSTIYKILEKIIENQKEYFEAGENYLKPMTLKIIADSLGIHESTASRAIKGKYISTKFGIIQIKKLFTKGLSSEEDSGDISSNIIKKYIQESISSENNRHPFSDQKLCEILNDKGINIARRTVAKYREELGILPSSKRKRF